MDLLISTRRFCIGFLKRYYFWLFALFLDPLDIYNKFRPENWPELVISTLVNYAIFVGIILIVAILTYHELRMEHEPARRPDDPPDVVVAKKELSDFVAVHVMPAIKAIHEAVRVGAYVYQSTWRESESNMLGFWGITSRVPDQKDAAFFTEPNNIRVATIEVLEKRIQQALAHYKASYEMLNMVCKLMVDTNKMDDKRNYQQVDGNSFIELVTDWYDKHSAMRAALSNLASGSSFPTLRAIDQEKYFDNQAHQDRTFAALFERHDSA